MPSLADIQSRISEALVGGELDAVLPWLAGGRSAAAHRFAVHQRHYATSLSRAILDRFPATIWLVGSPLVTAAAAEFVRAHPPTRPCIAEYGDEFPMWLASRVDSKKLPYLEQFAMLEWQVGKVSVATEDVPLSDWPAIDPNGLAESGLRLQPSLAYLRLDWPLDELLSFYLSDEHPAEYALMSRTTWLELRGARGSLNLRRLRPGTFAFRTLLMDGATLGDAAASALDRDAEFDPGLELTALLGEGLIVGIQAQSDRSVA
jgi:hypothetical protein